MVVSEKNGTILAAHCTCMAGLGEVCTHVAAVLFFESSAVEIRDSRTVTQENINFKSAKYLEERY